MFSATRVYLVVILCLLVFAVPTLYKDYPAQIDDFIATIESAASNVTSQLAAVILHNPRTISELQTKFATNTLSLVDMATTTSVQSTPQPQPKVRILLVPGHEPNYGGTEFGSLKEREMNVELAQDLSDLLLADPHFQVYITRDNQAWNPVFDSFFKDNWDAIKAWQKDSHNEMMHLISIGSTTKPGSKVIHNTVPTKVALRLYGITKWANENIIDVVVHIHFNDFPDHKAGVPGKYTGFSIYVPVGQYANSTTTKAVAESVFKRLSNDYAVSNLPGESSGIVDEPDLIAIGANNTADAASMLIEYGYIYESKFRTVAKRSATLKTMAKDTYLGLLDFFSSDVSVTPRYF